MAVGIPMVADHIEPLASGGASVEDNLCLCCYRCNEFKGARHVGPDPETGVNVALFHPRRQRWREHFAWDSGGLAVRGLTLSGRATVLALRMTDEWIMQARRIWVLAGLHPTFESPH